MRDPAALTHDEAKWLLAVAEDSLGVMIDEPVALRTLDKLRLLERRLRPVTPKVVYDLTRVDAETVDILIHRRDESETDDNFLNRIRERVAEYLGCDSESLRTRWLTAAERNRLHYSSQHTLRVTLTSPAMERAAANLSRSDIESLLGML